MKLSVVTGALAAGLAAVAAGLVPVWPVAALIVGAIASGSAAAAAVLNHAGQ